MFEFDCGGRLIGHIVQDVHDRLVAEMFTTAKAAGADAITALYHSCYRQFCAYERAQAMEVVHYTTLVAEALWLPPKEEVFKKLKLDSNPDKAADELKARAASRGLTENRLRSTRNAHFSK